MMVMNDAPYVIYLANLHTRELIDCFFRKSILTFVVNSFHLLQVNFWIRATLTARVASNRSGDSRCVRSTKPFECEFTAKSKSVQIYWLKFSQQWIRSSQARAVDFGTDKLQSHQPYGTRHSEAASSGPSNNCWHRWNTGSFTTDQPASGNDANGATSCASNSTASDQLQQTTDSSSSLSFITATLSKSIR